MVVVNAAPDVAAGEQAQRGAQGKEGGLIGGQEQDGGDHAQRPRQEGGVFPPPLPPDQFAQQSEGQKAQAGADQPQRVDDVHPLRAQESRRAGVHRRLRQHESQEAQGEADGLVPLLPVQSPNIAIIAMFLLRHLCSTSPVVKGMHACPRQAWR